MGLATVTGLRRLGFFIPYRYAAGVPPPGARPAYAALAGVFRDAEKGFRDVVARIDGFAADLEAIAPDASAGPRWRQDWFPRLDAAAAYALVRQHAPARIVEVGCGHSTRFLARAVTDGGIDCHIRAIDPAPRADLRGLGVEAVAATVQEAGTDSFAALQAGDVLSIDSSHVLMPGSDVDLLINTVLPALPPGVLVHVHDIFLPDDYPAAWAWRGYNEQLAIGALLQGAGYRVLWASHYVTTRMAGALEGTVLTRLEAPPGAHESSLWLVKTEAARPSASAPEP